MRKLVLHPLLLPIFAVMSLYVHNLGLVPFRDVLVPLLVAVALSGVLWLLLSFLVKSKTKSAVIVSAFNLLFFSFVPGGSQAVGVVCRLQVFGAGCTAAVAWLWPFLVLFIMGLIVFFVLKAKSELTLVSEFLNLMSVCLVVMMLGRLFYVRAQSGTASPTLYSRPMRSSGEEIAGGGPLGPLPDIYYIIVDAYARGDILDQIYDYDNSEFLSYLAEKGFYVAGRARSNYCQTTLSLASSLNSVYLDDLANQIGRESTNRRPLGAAIEDNRVFAHLRQHGYKIMVFSGGYSMTELPDADIRVSPDFALNQFQSKLVNVTPIPLLLRLPFLPSPYDLRRDRILFTLEHLADPTGNDGPTFVFAHILAPHQPFVFGPNGEPIEPAGTQVLGLFTLLDSDTDPVDTYVPQYADQLSFVSKKLRQVIDEILSRASEPPIIIIQADHGPASTSSRGSTDDSYLRERMSIFSAYYFPDQNYDSLYEDITPVNTFRVVLNQTLGTDYEMLQDASYYSSYDYPYKFVDVTDQVVSYGD
ncbi:sulfatase-like hydrolase/transferase [Chloroflexota bacterium]